MPPTTDAKQPCFPPAAAALALLLAAVPSGCGSESEDPGEPSAFDDTADDDRDGLANGVELRLGIDPDQVDTDGDGLADAREVADVERPADSDGDGFIDALESDQLDNDRDREPDQSDKADAGGWQVAYARTDPSVIANDGKDATRVEVQLIGARPEKIALGMDAENWIPYLAPDELEVDGKPLGQELFELFDDGSHGDRRPGDGIYTRGGITTRMVPRGFPGSAVTPRGEVMLGALRVTMGNQEETRQLGYTREPGPQVFPGGLLLNVIDAAELRPTTKLSDAAQRTEHALNVVDAEVSMALQRDLSTTEPALIWDTVNLVRPALDLLEKEVDFLYVYPGAPSYGPQAGLHRGITSEAAGLGAEVWEAAPAWEAGKLKSVVVLDYEAQSPILHETMHHWGVELADRFGFHTATQHWGTAGTYGVLGGFDPATLVDHGDGTFTVGMFADWGNDWATTPFSPIELYLMGFIGPEQVAPIPVLTNVEYIAGDDSTVTMRAEQKLVTIDDIVAEHGPRLPDATSAQKDFEGAFVIFSGRLLTAAELAFVDSRARAIGAEASSEIISFHEAAGGLGTMRTELSKRAK